MLKNTFLKAAIITVIAIVTILLLTNISLGFDPDYYEPELEEQSSELKLKAGKILDVVSIVGTILSVVILMIVGIKYMLGSIEEKAEYKKTMLTYLIGAIILFSATTLPNILYNIGTSINIIK